MARRSLKNLSYREVRRRLMVVGFEEIAQTGSHVKFAKQTSDGTRTAIVPKHREIAAGTLRSVLRQAGISPDSFAAL
jgi:predicted RNA binding protein YcfA (HicA-like mRNA interferase family)